jgi:hypothetical protein
MNLQEVKKKVKKVEMQFFLEFFTFHIHTLCFQFEFE